MSTPAPALNAWPSVVPPGTTATGVRTVRQALGRFQTILGLSVAVSLLILVESYLTSIGVFERIPAPGSPFSVSWLLGLQIGLAVAVGVAIAILVLVIFVLVVMGAVAWRRGVLAVVAASPELGVAQVDACRQARRDHSTTLWLFLVLVLVAIVVSVAFAGVNGTLSVLGVGTLPGTVGSVATSIATASVLVAIYYYGTRHLAGLISSVASPAQAALLGRGRERILFGAAVGVVAAFSSVSWGFNAAAVVSLILILTGVRMFTRAYDLWLAEHPVVPTPVPAPAFAPG